MGDEPVEIDFRRACDADARVVAVVADARGAAVTWRADVPRDLRLRLLAWRERDARDVRDARDAREWLPFAAASAAADSMSTQSRRRAGGRRFSRRLESTQSSD